MPVVGRSRPGSAWISAQTFSWKCSPETAGCRPKKYFHCPTKMITAMPEVKPTMTGFGMKRITLPSCANPIASSITPAIRVAT